MAGLGGANGSMLGRHPGEEGALSLKGCQSPGYSHPVVTAPRGSVTAEVTPASSDLHSKSLAAAHSTVRALRWGQGGREVK